MKFLKIAKFEGVMKLRFNFLCLSILVIFFSNSNLKICAMEDLKTQHKSAAAESLQSSKTLSQNVQDKALALYKHLKAKTVGESVDVECLVCHEKAKVEGKNFINGVNHLLRLWATKELSGSDEKNWWLGLHTIGLTGKDRFSNLMKWVWSGYVGHPCHLACMAKLYMDKVIVSTTPIPETEIENFMCPAKDKALNLQEIGIIQHFLDIATPDWSNGKESFYSIQARALKRKKFSLQASIPVPSTEEPVEDGSGTGASVVESFSSLKLAGQVKSSVAKDHLAEFVGFQRIAEAISQGKERICASEDLATFLAAQSDFGTFQQFLGNPEMGMEAPNQIRDEIARRWIRNAAARVFNRLLRSFLELEVNACDATNPGPSVGKFGMGFLSILQMLGYEPTKGVKIVIQTKPRPDEYMKEPFPYQITIEILGLSELEVRGLPKEKRMSKTDKQIKRQEAWQSIDFSKDFDISVKFEKLPADAELIRREINNPTGTLISITPNVGIFSKEDLAELTAYTHYLDFYEPVATNLNGDLGKPIGGIAGAPQIFVNLTPDKLEVLDAGTGISLYVALFKLFIPSSSTKTTTGLIYAREQMRNAKVEDAVVRPVELVDFQGKTDTKSHFLITVNGVVAIDVAMEQDIKLGEETKDLLVRLPQAAQLTLARDELVMAHCVEHENDRDTNMRGKGPEEAFLNRVIDKTIAGCIEGIIPSNMLQNLCAGLKCWEKQTSNLYIKDRFSTYLCDQLSKKLSNKVVAAPSEFMKKFAPEKLGAEQPGFTPISLDEEMAGYNYAPLEDQLKEHFAKQVDASGSVASQLQQAGLGQKLIDGMNVFFVSSGPDGLVAPGEISKLGLKNSIFVPQQLLADVATKDIVSAKKYLVNKIATRFIDQDFSSQAEDDVIIVFTNATDFLHPESWDRVNFYKSFRANNLHDSEGVFFDKFYDAFTKNFRVAPIELKYPAWFRLYSINIADMNTKDLNIADMNTKDLARKFIFTISEGSKIAYEFFLGETHTNYLKNMYKFLNENNENIAKILIKKNRNLFLMPQMYKRAPQLLNFSIKLSDDVNPCVYFHYPEFYDKGDDFHCPFLPFKIENYAMSHYSLIYFLESLKCASFLYDDKTASFFLSEADSIEQLDKYLKENGFDFYAQREKVNNQTFYNAVNFLIDTAKKENAFFKPFPSADVINLHLNKLLNFFEIRNEADFSNQQKVIYFGGEKIWPINQKSLDSLEKLIWYLTLVVDKECIKLTKWREYYLPAYIGVLAEVLKYQPDDQFSQRMRGLAQGLLDGSKRLVFVGMKGVSEEEYLRIKDTIKKDLPHLVATEAILEKNFDGLSVIKALTPISGLVASVDPESKIDVLTNFKYRVATIIENYMNIPDSKIPFVYGGQGEKIKAQNSLPEMDDGQFKYLCDALASTGQQHLLKRLLDLTVDDLMERADERYQESDLVGKALYVPNVLFNSPLSILSNLLAALKPYNLDYALDVVKTIIENSTNEKELLFTVNLLMQEVNLKILQEKTAEKQKDLVGAVKFICKKFIPEKIDKESILDAFEKCRKMQSVGDKIEYFTKKQEVRLISDYLKNVLDPGQMTETRLVVNNEFFEGQLNIDDLMQLAQSSNVPTNPFIDVGAVLEFSLKQLINAHVAGQGIVDLLKDNDLDAARPIIRKSNKSFDIGKITQSVEFGSEREPIHATLIECLQNSVDVVRGFIEDHQKGQAAASMAKRIELLGEPEAINQLGKIEYTLELMRINREKASFCLTIVDHVGFPSLKQFLTDFMLPDYSSKSPELGNVGDMGNGTFKIYQHATKVLLLTRMILDPNKVYLLMIRPMRSATTNLIEDLSWDCFDVSQIIEKTNPNFFGTSFKIIFEKKDKIDSQSDYLSTKNFLLECMSSVDVDLDLVDEGKLKLLLKEPGRITQLNQITPNKLYVHPFQKMLPGAQSVFKRKNKRVIKDISTHPIFKISKRPNKYMQSYLTTGGIPFKALGSILEAEKLLPPDFAANLRYGHVVDIALNTYEPVQSRTKLKMDTSLKTELRRALFEFYFARGIMLASGDEASDGFLSTHFTHFESEISDIAQLRLGDVTFIDFQAFYNAFLHEQATSKKLTDKDFFDFYQSLWIESSVKAPRCLHEFIELEINEPQSFYNQLTREKNAAEAQSESEFTKFIKNRQLKYLSDHTKLNVSDEEYQELSKEFLEAAGGTHQSWVAFRNQKILIFENMIHDLTKNATSSMIPQYISQFYEKVITPWFTKKFKKSEPKFKNFSDLTEAEPRFKTAKMCAYEQSIVAAAVKNIGAGYVAGDKEFDAIKEFFASGGVKAFLDTILQRYTACFFQSLNITDKAPSTAYFAYEEKELRGYYNHSGYGQSKIVINLKYCKFSELLEFAVSLFRFCSGKEDSLKRVMKTTLYQDIFDETMKGGNISLLTHELEHARRDDSTCHGAHTDGQTPDGQRVNFNACARAWMAKAVEGGFKDEWYKFVCAASTKAAAKFKEFLTEDSKQKEWNEFLSAFKELEKIRPNIAKEIGF